MGAAALCFLTEAKGGGGGVASLREGAEAEAEKPKREKRGGAAGEWTPGRHCEGPVWAFRTVQAGSEEEVGGTWWWPSGG